MAKIEVEVPEIPFPGAQPQSHFWRRAAENLESDFPAGGSNVRAAIANVLRQIASAL